MSGRPTSQRAMHKPCICRVFPSARWLWRPTGALNARRQAQFKCRLCGATTWKPAEVLAAAGELGGE